MFATVLQPSINTTNIDTLLVATDQTERIVEPPENVQEKIAFIFNNLSQSNMTQKASSAQVVLSWFFCSHGGTSGPVGTEWISYIMEGETDVRDSYLPKHMTFFHAK